MNSNNFFEISKLIANYIPYPTMLIIMKLISILIDKSFYYNIDHSYINFISFHKLSHILCLVFNITIRMASKSNFSLDPSNEH